MDAPVRFVLLGGFEVHVGGRTLRRFRTQKTASLLACLALHRSRAFPRDLLVERFWPDSDFRAGRTNLSVALNALRRQLEPPGTPPGAILLADHAQVLLNPETFATDVEAFERAAQEARASDDPAAWEAAADRYGGELLAGLYDDWLLPERDRIRETYQDLLRRAVDGCAARGATERAVAFARRLVQSDPLQEAFHQRLIRLLIDAGRPQDALAQHRALERTLAEVLGAAPSDASRALVDGLAEAPTPSPAAAAPAASRPSDEPAAAGIPFPVTRFFGRDDERERLGRWLVEPDGARLVTITGPGGMGKTRLAAETARRRVDAFPGGVWFVPLTELDDPARFGEALRDALGLERTVPTPLEQVVGYLRGREGATLLVLDGAERAVAGVAPVVERLLLRIERLRCLVTSRRTLSLPGEREVPLEPLPTPADEDAPDPQALLALPSVALFVDRAQIARPDFQVTPRNAAAVGRICRALEGLPLSLELAAARVRSLTPAQILERLTERFDLLAAPRADPADRHRSLWATIDWSVSLLSPGVRQFFGRLSVFPGGWTLEAAEAVCWDDAVSPLLSPADVLGQLRGHSLVQTVESETSIRFRMLESLRAFASETLAAADREEAEGRLARYFQGYVRQAPRSTEKRTVWFTRLEEDLDNLRAVLAWSLRAEGGIGIGLEIAGVCRSFWWLRGHLSEGRRWYARLLERPDAVRAPEAAAALLGAGNLAYLQGDFAAAQPRLEQCLAAALTLGDAALVGFAREALGSLAYRQGDHEGARRQYEAALAIAQERAEPLRIASSLGNLANIAQATGDYATSRALNTESLALWRQGGDRYGEGRTLSNLANLARSQGDLAEARAFYDQSLALKRALKDRYATIFTLRGIAEVAVAQADYAAAVAVARESLALAAELDVRTERVEVLQVLAKVLAAVGEDARAAEVDGALDAAREAMGYPLPPEDQTAHARRQEALRAAMGTPAYEGARRRGLALTLARAQALAEASLGMKGF